MLMVNNLVGFGGKSGGVRDPYFNNVVLLMHMEGENNSTTFTDIKGHTFTAGGAAKITTSNFAVGTSSLTVTAPATTGTPQRITTPDSADFYLGSGDFTIEARVRMTVANNGGNSRYFISQVNNLTYNNQRSFAVGLHATTGIVFYYTTNGLSDNLVTFYTTFELDTFYSISISRVGNTFYAHKDGVLVSSYSFNVTLFDSPSGLSIGSFGEYATGGYGFLDWSGQIDELRLTKGVGRYTSSNYTPAPFPDS